MAFTRRKVEFVLGLALVAVVGVLLSWLASGAEPGDAEPAGRLPRLRPDYCGVTLPPNIAPPNFCVDEPGSRYFVRIRSAAGGEVKISGRSPGIRIPAEPWRRILGESAGGDCTIDVSVKGDDGRWRCFDTIVNHVAREPVDPWVAYRQINPLYNYYLHISIRQRNLETYEENAIWDNSTFSGCINCHTFFDRDPSRVLIPMRSGDRAFGYGMFMFEGGEVRKVDTRTPRSLGLAKFNSWHPSGRFTAFSMNNVRQFFHTVRNEVRDFLDMDSDLAVFMVDSCTVTSTPQLANPDYLETWPCWSADGRELYFCRAPILWENRKSVPPPRYAEVRYSLVRMPYETETGKWGEMETVLSAKEIGKSVSLPRFSPDGRWLVFCLSDYSAYPSVQPDSDLFIMDAATGEYRRMECNSDRAESWHSWSSNSRWLVFSSKRGDGLVVKVCLVYVDENGRESKPFVMPQEDPASYDTTYRLRQLPELITGPVTVTEEQLVHALERQPWIGGELPMTGATPHSSGDGSVL